MDPKGRVLRGAWTLATLAVLVAAPARAQLYEDERITLGLNPDPLARSPRMVGMGRLTYVVEDVHWRYDLWEYSRNPAGLMDTDSSSTIELYPGTSSQSAAHDEASASGTRERQDFALRELSVGFDAWRRSGGKTAFGTIGEFTRLRADVPHTLDTEQRFQFNVPFATAAISGTLPFLMPDRFRYGADIRYRYQSSSSDYRTVVSNAAGDYIDKNGTTVPPPDVFTPTVHGVRSLGLGGGGTVHVAPWLQAAAAYDYLSNAIEGKNEGGRYSTELREDRPFSTTSVQALGTIQKQARYAAEYRSWSTRDAQQRYFSTISTGPGQNPVQGRGEYQHRKEKGYVFRGRVTWAQGPLTVAGGGSYYSRDVKYREPDPNDTQSFNAFLRQVSRLPDADSLALPDSAESHETDETVTDVGGGVSYRLPWRGAIVGAEYHIEQGTFDLELASEGTPRRGPDRDAWDIRTGAEVPLGTTFTLRGGYIYRWDDQDKHTAHNEYVTNTLTLGFGLKPSASSWTAEAGYGFQWGTPDFENLGSFHSQGHQGLLRVRWEL